MAQCRGLFDSDVRRREQRNHCEWSGKVQQGYRLLSLAQKKQLGMQGNMLSRPMLAWVREVHLYGNDDQPWVQAQSIFPILAAKGRARRLQQLKGTPIGYVLFKRNRTCAPPSERFIQHTVEGWQRQTRYDWHGRTLLIGERFLPAFESIPEASNT